MSVHCTITRSVQCIYSIHCNLSSAIQLSVSTSSLSGQRFKYYRCELRFQWFTSSHIQIFGGKPLFRGFLQKNIFFQIKNELQSIELYTTISWTRPINSKHSDWNADLTKYIYILKNSIIKKNIWKWPAEVLADFLDELLGKLEKNRIFPRLWTFCKLNMLFFLALRLVFLLADLLQVNLLETARLVKFLIYVFLMIDWLIVRLINWFWLIDWYILLDWIWMVYLWSDRSYKNL